MNGSKFVTKHEISIKRMLTVFSDALALPELKEGLRVRNVEFEATLPDVRIDCLLFLTPEEMQKSHQGVLKDLGTINVLHIKAIGDNFTEKHLQTYLGQGLIVNGSNKVSESEIVVLLVLCSEKPSNILENDVFQFESSSDEEWVYKNKHKWFFPVRILVLNDIDLTDENLPTYFPFVPFITVRKKFLEFFPRIGNLDIPEAWKFFCDLFAAKTNPLYWEVTKMTFWLTADDIQHALKHVRQEEMPAVIDRILSGIPPEERLSSLDRIFDRMLPEQRLSSLDVIFDKIPSEEKLGSLDVILDKMPPEQRLGSLDIILDKIPPEQRLGSLDKMKDFIPKEQLKEWARRILDGSE